MEPSQRLWTKLSRKASIGRLWVSTETLMAEGYTLLEMPPIPNKQDILFQTAMEFNECFYAAWWWEIGAKETQTS